MRWDQWLKEWQGVRQITATNFWKHFRSRDAGIAQNGLAVRTAPLTHHRLGRSGCRPHVALASANTSLHGAHALPAPACTYVASKARKWPRVLIGCLAEAGRGLRQPEADSNAEESL